MSHRRSQRNALITKKEKSNVDINNSLNKMSMKIKKEKKKFSSNKQSKKLVFATILVVLSITSGFFILSNFNSVGTTSFTNTIGQTLPLPPNMPSRYDPTLTQNPKLSTAYQFALDHKDVLSQLICYCGCNNPNHQPYHANNDQCFWTVTGQKETHAENCSTCDYIALSAKTLYEANWSIGNIRAFIDAQYT